MTISSDRLASYLNAEHVGESREVDGVNSLRRATSTQLAYCTTYDTSEEITDSRAGVLIAPQSVTAHPRATVLVTENPRTAFVKAADEFFVEAEETSVHPSASVDDEAVVGDRCSIGANVAVGPNVTIGDDCTIHPGVVIGSDGLMFARDETGRLTKHVQTGGVVIEDDVEVGSNSTIDRSIFEETVIGEGTKIDDQVHIAHDCRIGEHVTVPAGTTLAGHVTIEDHVRLNPEVAIGVYVTIGEGAEVGMNSTVLDDVDPYTKVVGTPAEPVGPSRFAK